MKKISIVIPMFNEAEHIQRTIISAIQSVTFAGLQYEVIAVDNNSSDNSKALAEQLGATVIVKPDLKIGALRNAGAEITDGDYIAFLDADIEVPHDWLTSCLALHSKGNDVIALDCDTPPQAPWFARVWQKRSMSKSGADRYLDWLATPNLFLTRDIFTSVGGFNSQLASGEDKEFGLRLHAQAAKQVSIAQPAALHWGYEKTWTEWFKKEFWRQSSHIHLLTSQKNLRLARFPILCSLTTLSTFLFILISLSKSISSSWPFLVLSLITPALLALRQSDYRSDFTYTCKLCFLHWLRLHIGFAAIINSAYKLIKREKL